MKPLPTHRYQYATWKKAKVHLDYHVEVERRYYSVPYRLIGKTVEVVPVGEVVRMEHGGQLVAEHPRLAGKHQMRILREHGPGPAARNARQRYALVPPAPRQPVLEAGEVEVRELAVYEELAA